MFVNIARSILVGFIGFGSFSVRVVFNPEMFALLSNSVTAGGVH